MAKNQATRTASKSQIPGWVWLFTGVVTGLFIAFLVHLAKLTPQAQHDLSSAEQTSHSDEKGHDQEASGLTFEFYSLLPKTEVVAHKSEPAEQLRAASDSHRSQQNHYLLQAGSFRNNDDAQSRRAALLMLGFETNIQSAKVKNGETWHRVMVGPFTNPNVLHRAQDNLTNNGIDSLAIQIDP